MPASSNYTMDVLGRPVSADTVYMLSIALHIWIPATMYYDPNLAVHFAIIAYTTAVGLLSASRLRMMITDRPRPVTVATYLCGVTLLFF